MSLWSEPSPSDFDRWEKLVADGADPSDAAKSLGFGGSSTFKRADPQRHAQILDLWRDMTQAKTRVTALETLLEIAGSKEQEPGPRVSASNTLARIGGLLSERVEVTGADGGPIEVQHKERLTLDDVARRATELGLTGPSGSISGRVPAASDVLPAPHTDQPAASDLPA